MATNFVSDNSEAKQKLNRDKNDQQLLEAVNFRSHRKGSVEGNQTSQEIVTIYQLKYFKFLHTHIIEKLAIHSNKKEIVRLRFKNLIADYLPPLEIQLPHIFIQKKNFFYRNQ